MDVNFPYRFSLPNVSNGQIMNAGEAEKRLLKNFQFKQRMFEGALWKLIQFYSMTDQHEKASSWIQLLLTLNLDSEKQAGLYLTLGQLMEKKKDYNSAIDFYQQAIALKPTTRRVKYLSYNNLGYSLNQIGKHVEAEPPCRIAIEIDPIRHNAYKNLGVSLESQGQFLEAVEAYLQAVAKHASDPRALNHLKDMIERNPEILKQRPYLMEKISSGEKAVDLAQKVTRTLIRKEVGDPPQRLADAARILDAVHHLVIREEKSSFTREAIRKQMDISIEAWISSYEDIFRAICKDHPGMAPKILKEYRGLFRRVSWATYVLAKYGRSYIQTGNWRIVYM